MKESGKRKEGRGRGWGGVHTGDTTEDAELSGRALERDPEATVTLDDRLGDWH